jgi:hypothetical protein
MRGLVPGIHAFQLQKLKEAVDGRDKPGHDGMGDYASPEVSKLVASSASRAPLPAQTTNWKPVK